MNTKVVGVLLLTFLTPFALTVRSAQRATTARGAGVEQPPLGWRVGDLQAWVLETHNPSIALDNESVGRTVNRGAVKRSTPSVANRNANPLNIKLGSRTRAYVERGEAEISDITPLDGGYFLKFKSSPIGFRAAAELLQTGPYRTLDLASVFRRWTNNGFGAEILAGTQLDARLQVDQLGFAELEILLSAMAKAEGYQSSTIAEEIAVALNR